MPQFHLNLLRFAHWQRVASATRAIFKRLFDFIGLHLRKNDMKHRLLSIVLVTCCYLVCGGLVAAETVSGIPDHLTLPSDKRFDLDWRKEDANHYLKTRGDYNGDGKTDYAYILEHKRSEGLVVLVLLSSSSGGHRAYEVYDTGADQALVAAAKSDPDWLNIFFLYYGLQTVPPGKYLTACGKGYYDCGTEGAETPVIELTFEAIEFFHFEVGGSRYFYWDSAGEKFRYVWISD